MSSTSNQKLAASNFSNPLPLTSPGPTNPQSEIRDPQLKRPRPAFITPDAFFVFADCDSRHWRAPLRGCLGIDDRYSRAFSQGSHHHLRSEHFVRLRRDEEPLKQPVTATNHKPRILKFWCHCACAGSLSVRRFQKPPAPLVPVRGSHGSRRHRFLP